ncbi:MAG: ATP-binding protein [Alkalispirochaetaceae bacterium]
MLNALKHAFPDDRSGSVDIRTSVEDETCLVIVPDDGIGISTEVAPDTSSLGMRLVSALAEQISAEVQRETSNVGTRYTVRFALETRGPEPSEAACPRVSRGDGGGACQTAVGTEEGRARPRRGRRWGVPDRSRFICIRRVTSRDPSGLP